MKTTNEIFTKETEDYIAYISMLQSRSFLTHEQANEKIKAHAKEVANQIRINSNKESIRNKLKSLK